MNSTLIFEGGPGLIYFFNSAKDCRSTHSVYHVAMLIDCSITLL